MSSELVFLLEEPSMKAFLAGLLPRILPASVELTLIAHEGKGDLEASLPRKLRGWRKPGAKFVVVRDQDAADCKMVKARLAEIARAAGRNDTVVRIACRELEAWILGDLETVAKTFGKPQIANLGAQKKFRNPDRLGAPAEELRRLLGSYSKVAGARLLGPVISVDPNTSRSFQVFVTAVRRLVDPVRLAQESAKLRPEEEKASADETLAGELEWPEY
jgi:hypothetical protein